MMTTPTLTTNSDLDLLLTDGALVLDASSLEGQFMLCPRAFRNYKLLKREPAKFYAGREFGKCVHCALEAYYKGQDPLDAINKSYPTDMPMEDHRTLDFAYEVIRVYKQTYPAEAWQIAYVNGQPVIERPFALPLGQIIINGLTIPIVWNGKIDMVIRTPDQRYFVLDHKTSSVAGQTFWSQFKLSTQQLGYCWATQELTGLELSGFYINAIFTRKPTKTGKGIECERQPYLIEHEDLERWRSNVLYICTSVLRHACGAHWPMYTKSCVHKYGECGYLEACACGNPQMEHRALMSNMYQQVTWSPTNEE